MPKKHQWRYTLLAGCALGGCGIWCMHLIGVYAVKFVVPSTGEVVPVRYGIGMTLVSMMTTVTLAYMSLTLCVHDPYFDAPIEKVIMATHAKL